MASDVLHSCEMGFPGRAISAYYTFTYTFTTTKLHSGMSTIHDTFTYTAAVLYHFFLFWYDW